MTEKRSTRGFASMNRQRHRELSSEGGKSVDAETRAFNDRKLAAEAGRKGGLVRAVQLGWRYCPGGDHFWHVKGLSEHKPSNVYRVRQEFCKIHGGKRG